MAPHLVVPCTGDELPRLREELYVLVPDGNSQVKPVIPYLGERVDGGQGCGELVCPFLSPSVIIPESPSGL